MGAGRFVGRVGGLAVALGVGAAVSLGSGIAWADESPGGGSESGGSTSTGGSSGGAGTSTSGTPASSTSTGTTGSGTPSADDKASPSVSPAEPEVKATGGSGSSHKRKASSSSTSQSGVAKRDATDAPKSAVTSRPVRHEDDNDASPAAPRAAKATPVAVAAPVTTTPAPVAKVEATPAVTAAATGVASAAVVDSSLLGGAPTSPLVNSPVLWVVAAGSRREFAGGSAASDAGASLAAAAAANAAAGAVPNTAPSGTVAVGKPSTTTGVVTGQVKGVDVDKDVLTYSAPSTTSKGSVVISATTGKFTYTPTVNARQTAATSLDPADKQDSFVVTITDAQGGVGTVTVPVAIDPNNIPVAGTHLVNPPNDTTGVVTGTVKVTDADKDKLTYTTAANTAKGKITLNASTGAFTYTPTQAAREAAAGTDVAAKQDSFTVTVKDAQGALITTLVTVDVSPNQAPVDVALTNTSTNPTTGAITGTVSATDPDGVPGAGVKYTVGATATKSKVTVNATTGALVYTPTAAARHAASLTVGAITSDSFTVTVTDPKGAVTNQLVTVAISPFNATPTSSLPAGKTNITTGVVTGTIKTADADKDKLAFSPSTVTTTKGTFTVNTTTGAYTYAPNQAARLASGAAPIGDPATTDSITVTISDGHTGGTITQTLTVPVAPNRAPITPSASVNDPNPTTGVMTGTVKAVDLDKDVLTYTVPPSTGRGAVTINTKTGAFTYTPTQSARQAAADGVAGDAAQSDSFTVTITDARGASITQAVTVAVSPNKAPIDAVITNQNTNPANGVVTGTVTAIDPDGAPGVGPKYTAVAPASGKVTINATTGAFTYTPSAAARHAASLTTGAVTSDTFTVSITDVKGAVTTKVVPVTITPANAVPTATVTVNKPNATTGIVTGTVKGVDADKDVLTYTAPASTTKGTVTINPTTGAFTYTPSATARDAAAGTAAADKADTFTVTITDGHTGGIKTQVVNVTIAPKAVVGVVGTVDLGGENYEAVMNGTGTRAVITTVTGDDTKGYSTTVTVVNTTTGAKIGTSVKLVGQSNGVVFSDDGTKALVATYVGDTDSGTVRVAVINASTGKQVGTALSLQGSTYLSDALQFNADGSRAILALDGYDGAGAAVQRLTLVNTLTGARVGVTREYANDQSDDALSFVDPVHIDLNPDGSRLIVTTHTADSDINVESTQVTIINTATGIDMGTATVTGGVYSPVSYNADYTRAILAYTDIVDDTTFTTHVIVLNVTTGARVGPTVDQVGSGVAQLSGDGSLIVVNTTVNDAFGDGTARIAVYTVASGVQVGNTVTVDGVTILPAQFNAAGTRAVVAVYQVEGAGPTGVRVVVVNTATGAQVGAAVDVAGTPFGLTDNDPRTLQPLQLNTDGSRALVTTTDGGFTNVALINTATGTQLGTTLSVAGDVSFEAQDGTSYLPPLYNDDDSRAFITTVSGDGTSGYVTRVALLNTVNGAQVGGTIALAGAPGAYADDANVVSAGNRAAYLTYTGSDDTGYITRVAIINTDNGAQLGATREFTGSWTSFVQFNAAGNRLTVIADTQSTDTDQATTKLSVYNASTGAQVGSTLTFTGDDWTGATVDDDPSRAIVYTASATSSTVTVVDLLTGSRMGSTLTLTGEAWSTYRSDDSSRVVVASLIGTGTTTRVATLQIGGPTGAPINGAFTASSPNATTGVVTGTVTATDSAGDPLSYSGTQTTTNGTVTVAADGTFTYTPTAAARHAALAPNGAQTDTFNVIASDPLGNSLAVAVTVAIQPGTNVAPAGATASAGLPNTTSGVVTGTLTATDADGDALTYTGPSTTTKGSLSITGTTFTYTPSVAARQTAAAANATAADKQDTFTITVSDGHGGTAPISVTVAIQPATTTGVTGVSTVGSVMLNGTARDGYFSGDGTKAVVATMTTSGIAVSVLNTATGTQIGNSVTVGGVTVTGVQFSTDGTRAVVSTNDADYTVHVAIINTANGIQVGTTYTASNSSTGSNSVGGFSAVLNADGTRAAIASTGEANDGSAAGTVVLLNTANGSTVYNSGQVAGIAQVSFSANGGRAVATFQAPTAPVAGTTTVRFVNAVSGAQIGSTLTRTGATSVALNADGSRAILADFTQTATGPAPVLTTKVALYTVGGNQIGNTVTVGSAALLPPQFTADGSRAVLTLLGIDTSTPNAPYRTGLVVINGTTGAQVGSVITLVGFPGGVSSTSSSALTSAVLNSAGTRATLVARAIDGSTTSVAVVNLANGTQVGSTITATGGPIGGSAKLVQASADGTRVLVNSFTQDLGNGTYTTDAVVIDTATGAKLYELNETSVDPVALQLTADGARLLVGRTDGTDTTLSMVTVSTGAQIGSTLTIAGVPSGPAEFSADGTRVVVAAGTSDGAQVVVINTVTGAQIGTTAVLAGLSPEGPSPAARLSANGTYILVPTYTATANSSTTTATVLKIT